MPKKIDPDEVYEDEDDFDDEDEEEQAPPPRRQVGRPGVRQPVTKAPAPVVAKRYASFKQEAAEGIIDTETQEVIASDIWAALADIKSQLDRIETNVGVM